MFDALVLSTVNALEFFETRRNVIRIPEVTSRLREAQSLWDQVSDQNLDLSNFIASDDGIFMRNLRMKNLASSLIQLGLVDRFLRRHPMPHLIAGLMNGDTALKVLAGQQTFAEFVQQSTAHGRSRSLSMSMGTLPVLAGISLAEFGLYREGDEGYELVMERQMDFRHVLEEMIFEHRARRLAVVGPGAGHIQSLLRETQVKNIEIVDVTTLDPALSWFWSETSSDLNLAQAST